VRAEPGGLRLRPGPQPAPGRGARHRRRLGRGGGGQVRTGQPARRFKDFRWATLDSWSRRRRVVGKAEWTRGAANPRFVVTSLKPWECAARELYERVYCARGDMENRVKECQLDLFADRASAATMRANQLRFWFASMAYTAVPRH
jgi:hypothetical protein